MPTGKGDVVQAKIISDMISSTDLETQSYLWDLGVVLEALSKPPNEPFRGTFIKHLTYQMVFLLAIASAGRGSELQVFDPQLPTV